MAAGKATSVHIADTSRGLGPTGGSPFTQFFQASHQNFHFHSIGQKLMQDHTLVKRPERYSLYPEVRTQGRASVQGRWARVLASLHWDASDAHAHPGAGFSSARHPGKERRTTLPSRPRAALFPFKSLHVAGGEGGAWTSLSSILFPCVRAGIYFFPSSTPSSPPPAPPSLVPFPPSLPPSLLGWVSAPGSPNPLRCPDARNSRQESALGSLLPPFPFPAPFPHPRSGSERRPEEPRARIGCSQQLVEWRPNLQLFRPCSAEVGARRPQPLSPEAAALAAAGGPGESLHAAPPSAALTQARAGGMENSSAASASSEAGSSRSQEIEELERFIDSYVLEYQVQGLLADKTEGDGESEKTQSHISQEEALNGGPPMKVLTEDWTADCSRQLDSSCPFSRGRAPPQQNGSKDNSLDVLGTDIWAANTFDSFSGATWDLQPEKLDFTQFHRRLRHTPKQPLAHIDREGCGKGKLEDGDGINLNDIEKVLPAWQGYHPMPHEVEIAHTKKLFRRRRNDRRRQQRPPGGSKPQQHGDHQPGSAKHNRDHQKSYQGGSAPHPSGRPTHHGYSQNRRWHHGNMKHPPGDKGEAGTHRSAKETVTVGSPKLEDALGDTGHSGLEPPCSPDGPAPAASERLPPQQPGAPEAEAKRKDSVTPERIGERPRVTLLQSSKDRLRRRLKEKGPDEVAVEPPTPQQNKMDKLIEILNSMRNNSSDVDAKLSTFMEEAQNSTNSEEMLGEIVRTIYQKAVSDRSFAFTAAKLCDKMALFMVEGTKFRSLLLNMLQKDFTVREALQQQDVERWLGFITFLCEVFGTMRSSTGEPFRVLVCPIYTCLRELLQSQDVKEDAVLCCSMELQSTGRLLEEQLPEMMTELLASARDKMLCPSESMLTRSLLLEVIELHANSWNPLTPPITQYYNRTIQKLTA